MALLGRFLMPEIEARNLHDIWFQQDGATCHTARETMDLLRSRFGKQFISRLGLVDWPPRSFDITPLDFYLSGYVLERVIQNWCLRMDELKRSCGQHLKAVIFKKSLINLNSRCLISI